MNPLFSSRVPRRLGALAAAVFALFVSERALVAAETARLSADQTAIGVPEWIRSSVIYEVNVRQYSASGKFAAVTADLPRLRALGIDVLWLMPIHPVGAVNRKGELGSYYAVQDYKAVNPEFGTEQDFKQLVDTAHAQGFRVILDWVGNHTAWDNPLAQQHPEYYVRDAAGRFTPPTGFDWTDVIQLDFTQPAVLEYQVDAMSHWVRGYGVDGFRCDFATGVPTSYWETLFARLRAVRSDLFFLAESELPQHQVKAFNASYAFDMMHSINAVAQGRSGVSYLDDTLARTRVMFPAGAVLLRYTSNHDENSWQGTEFERLGAGVEPFAVFTFLLDGIPLIYNGQEIGLDRRLEFFVRDPIAWPPNERMTAFYRTLIHLRRTHPAMRTGASERRLATTKNESVYAVLRESGRQAVVGFLNLSPKDVMADAYEPELAGHWRDAFTGEPVVLIAKVPIALRSWKYRVLVRTP